MRLSKLPFVEYSLDVGTVICERLIEGESLAAICRSPGYPSRGTVVRWAATIDTFKTMYFEARELQAEQYAEEIISIADDSSNDWMNTEAGRVPDREVIARSRLRVDSRKWIACKLLPKKYGDRTDLNLSGSMKVETITSTIVDPKAAP